MSVRTLAILTGMSLMVAPLACAPKAQPPAPQEPDPMALPVPEDAATRIRELRTQVDQLASFSDQLPGQDEEVYRPLMAQALQDLSQALRLAHPPGVNGAFRIQYFALHEAARQLRSAPLTTALRPQTTAALRSAYNALESIQQRMFPENAELTRQLEAHAAALAPLETDEGALYRLSSTQALRQAIKSLQVVADLYEARIPAGEQPAQVTTPTADAPAGDPPAEQSSPAAPSAPAPEASETPAQPEAQPEAPAQPDAPAQPEASAPETEPSPAPAPQPELNK